MIKSLLAAGIVLLLLLGWVGVQYAYRRFAEKHPELGPYRDDVGGCGGCGCGTEGESCSTNEKV